MTIKLSQSVLADIKTLLALPNLVETPYDVNGGCECGEGPYGDGYGCECCYMELTVACNEDGTEWNYQTGDNSYTGGAYLLPHWAVVFVRRDTDKDELLINIENQLLDKLNGV